MIRNILTRPRPPAACRQMLQRNGRRNVHSAPDMTYQREMAAKGLPVSSRRGGGIFSSIYSNIFMRTPIYYTFWFAVAVVANQTYDVMFQQAWNNANQGKQFDDVIPSRFPNLPPDTEADEPEGEDGGGDDEEGGGEKEDGEGEDKEGGGDEKKDDDDGGDDKKKDDDE